MLTSGTYTWSIVTKISLNRSIVWSLCNIYLATHMLHSSLYSYFTVTVYAIIHIMDYIDVIFHHWRLGTITPVQLRRIVLVMLVPNQEYEQSRICVLRDRPFNLKGGLWFFVSFRNLFSDNTS
jgi:hypothetical protein